MTFIHSMVAKSSNHTPATFQMNTGFTMNGFPCLGAWLSYGLGTENQDLPAFVVLPDPRGLPAGGAINWTTGFLPADPPGRRLPHLRRADPRPVPADRTSRRPPRKAGLDLLAQMNREFLDANPGDSTLAARVRSYELAARMQTSIPEVGQLRATKPRRRSGSTASTTRRRRASAATACWPGGCWSAASASCSSSTAARSARRASTGTPTKTSSRTTRSRRRVMDKPVAGLLKDLKQRGMLDDTLVLWTTEFGRTPFTQGVGGKGRDHHPARLHLLDGRRRAEAGLRATAPPTRSATSPPRTR